MRKLLVQLDADRLPSAFDRIVALDAGADEVLSYAPVAESDVRNLVHGAIFTRGPKDLKNTALFIGGSSMPVAEHMLVAAREAFFGPFKVSMMLDPNGSNTTAAAAVVKLVRAAGGDVRGSRALVLAGTGPVGTRAAGLLSRLGVEVKITSRDAARGSLAARHIAERFGGKVEHAVLAGARESQPLVAVGRAAAGGGTRRRPARAARRVGGPGAAARHGRRQRSARQPASKGSRRATTRREREGVKAFGALAIGGLKMKAHKAAIARLFERNDLVLDAEEIYDLAAAL